MNARNSALEFKTGDLSAYEISADRNPRITQDVHLAGRRVDAWKTINAWRYYGFERFLRDVSFSSHHERRGSHAQTDESFIRAPVFQLGTADR